MKTSSLRQVIVAMTIAVSAATVHGAWFASTDARETAPIITISTWDFYEKGWTSATHDLAADPLTVRHSEDTIVAISGVTVSLPAGLNAAVLDETDLATLEIPVVPGATQYLHLLVSTPENLVGSWPVIGSGPIDPDETDLAALDVNGSVGVHTVTTDGGGTFTWDIGRWSKGDIFLGLNNHTYKVLDRNGNFKRFVASADYDQPGADEIYNVTTGCASNWKTGEVYATNFGDYRPAINIIGRHPQTDYVGDLSPYSSPSRRISTRIDRTDDETGLYANEYTTLNYGIDTSPESVAFDADMNMYVGHSFGNFRQAPAAWQGDPTKVFEYDDEWTEYTMAVDGLPVEGWSWNDGWGWVVDETGVRMLLAPAGTVDPQAFIEKIYGTEVSPRLAYNADGSLKMATASLFYPAIAGLPGWDPNGQLPESFLSDPVTGAALSRLNAGGALVPSRWSMGKRLHKYIAQNGAYESTDAARDEFWTFSGRQGTDWIDLDVTGEVIYYTSEDSFIHRYRVKPGPNGEVVGQLPDVGADLQLNGVPTFGKLAVASGAQAAIASGGGTLGDFRFHGLRILPPGDGSGGFLVAVEDGLGVHRFTQDGRWVQRYYAHVDKDRNPQTGDNGKEHLVSNWYTLEVDPGGASFWASAHDNGWVVQFDIASGRVLKEIEAVDYVPQGDPTMPSGRRVEGICVMWEYTAPQEICFNPDGSEQGLDDDGDGYVDENCVAIEVCSAVSPGDDDGDGLSDQYDSDCSAELPPVATDDAYAMKQQDPAQPALTVAAVGGVLQLGPVPDYDRDSGVYADVGALTVTSFGANESSLTLTPGDTLTTPGVGTVVLQGDGSFVFTPEPAFHGVFTFAYKVTDGYPLSPDDRDVPNDGQDDTATVTITVAPKVADDGVFSLWVGETLSQGGLLTNDPAQSTVAYPVSLTEAGPSGTPVAFTGSRTFQTAQSNSVTVNANGSFDFTASNLAYGGPDHFTYAVHNTDSRSWNIATVTLNVMRPVITVVVPDQVKTYDGAPLPTICTVTSDRVADPAYTLTYAGTIRGGGPYGPTTTAPTAAGTYTATCVHTDIALGPVTDTGSIVINPVPLVVTAADTSRPYLAANPAVTRAITGFVNDETESVLSGATTCSTSVAQSANVGTYPDANTCTQTLSATNYTFSYQPGDLTITGFVLTVTASDTEKNYGDPNPSVTYAVTGFQGTDDATVINGTTTCSTAGGPNAGTYAGANTCTQTLSATNYSFVYVPGTLVIKKVPLVVTAATTTKIYGDPNPAVGRTITGFVNGDDAADLGGSSVCSTSTAAGPNVGGYNDVNTCTQNLTSANYTFSYVAGDFSITPRPLTAKANDKTIVLGSPLPTLDGTLTGGVVAGDVINVTYSSTNAGTVAGVFPGVLIPTVTAGGTTLLTNYTVTEIPGTLTVLSVAPCTGNDGYTTYSQGGWGSKPSGGNPGAFLAANFSTVYPAGQVQIGGTFKLTFTSASAIEKFLPGGGTSKPLTASDLNPTKSAAGNIAAQLLALRLATDFSAAGVTKRGLGSLVMQSGPLAGRTVDQILDLANAVVGGQPSALPSGLSITGLASILESLNLNYHEGTVNQGLLSCTGGPVTPPPPPPPPTDPPPVTGSGVCEGGVTKLVLKYIGSGSLNGVVYGQRSAPGKGPKTAAEVSGNLYTFATEEMGGLFESVSSGRLANNFTVFVGSTNVGEAHTSCSVPIYPGMMVGNLFEIVEVWSKGGGLIVRPSSN